MSCTKKPETEAEYDACMNIPPDKLTAQMLKTAHRWSEMASDEHAQQNNLASAYRLSRMHALYSKHAQAYCTDPEHASERVNETIDSQSNITCSMFDADGATMKAYCGTHDKHRINSRKTVEPTCTRAALGDAVFTELGTEYCEKNPKELWCSCHNIQTGVCDTDPSVAGCSMAKLDPNLADDAALGQDAFDTLQSMKECRFGVCEGDVLKSRAVTCPATMRLCGKNFPTATTRTNQVIRHCVVEAGGDEEDYEKWGAVEDNTDEILKALKPKKNEKKIAEMESRVATVGISVSSCVSCLMVLAAISLR